MVKQVLCIGQSDCCAVTGVQADLKTIHAFGGYAATVLTAVSARNTQGYREIMPVSEGLLRKQIEAVIDDLDIAAIKTGMLVSAQLIELVSEYTEKLSAKGVKIIVDPVLSSRFKKDFMNKEAEDALKRSLMIHTDVMAPNVNEASRLTGMTIRDVDDMKHAAEMLVTLGPKSVVLRGGDFFSGEEKVVDVLVDDEGLKVFETPRVVKGNDKDGQGATMASAIAVSLVQGKDLTQAYQDARAYINKALLSAEDIGKGFGPLNHCVTCDTE